MTERYLVPAEGPDEKKLTVALVASIEAAKKHGCSLTILVPALKHATGTIFSKVVGENFAKSLVKGKTVTIDGVPIVMRSKLTINPHSEGGVILSLWGGEKSLDKVDKAVGAKAVVVLPWVPSDIEAWSKNWAPTIITGESA